MKRWQKIPTNVKELHSPVFAWKMKRAPRLMAARNAAALMPARRSSMPCQRCIGELWFILTRSDGCRCRHRDDLQEQKIALFTFWSFCFSYLRVDASDQLIQFRPGVDKLNFS